MSLISFEGVKTLTTPEGSVKKITRKSDGVVLWEKVTIRIPNEYQEVEYIYIPNTAYINTKWTPTEGSLFNIKYGLVSAGFPFGTGYLPRLACSHSFSNAQLYNPDNSSWGIYVFDTPSSKIVDIETYTTSKANGCYVIQNGKKQAVGTTARETNFDAALPMLLGAWQYNATTIRQGEINLYYAKASDNGVPKFEMIPCYRKADGVIGMYDLVSKTFFTNAGTGSFTKGADV